MGLCDDPPAVLKRVRRRHFGVHVLSGCQGIGRQVLGAIQNKARELDINALHLEVARDNSPARKLYASAGFVARDRYLLMTAVLQDK